MNIHNKISLYREYGRRLFTHKERLTFRKLSLKKLEVTRNENIINKDKIGLLIEMDVLKNVELNYSVIYYLRQ